MLRKTLGALALLGLTLGLAGLAGEAFVRLSPRFAEHRGLLASRAADAEDSGTDRSALSWQLHPFLAWVQRPGTMTAMAREHDLYLGAQKLSEYAAANLRTNSWGFSSAIDDYGQVEEDDYAVGLFGGSVAWAVAVTSGDVFERALEARFPALEGRVVLLNFGSGGYKQPQQLAALMQAVATGVPLDLVINLDGFNEVVSGAHDARNGDHPFFPSRSHYSVALDLSGVSPTRSRILLAADVVREQLAAERIVGAFAERPWLDHSALLRVLGAARVMSHERRVRKLEWELQLLHHVARGSGPLDGLRAPCLEEHGGCFELIAELWQRTSRMMAAVAEEAGAGYLHALQPNQYVEGSKPLTEGERQLTGSEDERLGVQGGYPALRRAGEALRRDGIAFHDLTGVFADRTDTLYVDSCCHVNMTGNEILARELVARIDPAVVD